MEELLNTPAAGRNDNGPEPGVITRRFASQIETDGRTLDVRIVPYGERITHNDGLGGVPRGVDYHEEWSPGAFAEQIREGFGGPGRAKKIVMNFEHQRDIMSIIGHGLALREEPDGLHGSFTIHPDSEGDKALMLVREGVLDGISLEAKPSHNVRTKEGVIRRVKAHLHAVALCRFPAYSGARVLALREEEQFEEQTTFAEDLLPVGMNEETIERCRRLGIALPQRYTAQPAETDTPAESGTSEDGTRQAE